MNRNLWGRILTEHELEQVDLNNDEREILTNGAQITNGIDKKLSKIKCNRCNNHKEELFYCLPNGERYCINCLNLGRVCEYDKLYYWPSPNFDSEIIERAQLTWEGQLSKEQQRASKELIKSLDDIKRPHLIHAVTGAGKTEMIFQAIECTLHKGGTICIASPRVDVCLELLPRIQKAFGKAKVQILYGDSENCYEYSDITITTTHQLLRFKSAFNLMIVDEVDAFPFVDDDSLHFAVEKSVKKDVGKLVYLTATPDKKLENKMKKNEITTTILPARFHGRPLQEPTFKWIGDWEKQITNEDNKGKLWQLLQNFMAIQGRKLIFMPNIILEEKLYKWIKSSNTDSKLQYVHAKDSKRKEKVEMLRNGEIDTLITTTILERGVTFENCHVCVIGSEHHLYTSSSLIQISGRVGRKEKYPTGQLLFAHYGISKEMRDAKKQIKKMNHLARKEGLIK